MSSSTILLCFFIYIVDLNKAGLFERGFSGKGSSQIPHLVIPDLRNLNGIFRKNVTFDNIKSHKKNRDFPCVLEVKLVSMVY